MFLWPLTYLEGADNLFGLVQVLLVMFWIASAFLYISVTKRYLLILISYIILVLLNTRPPIGSLIYYHIFHSLPFFGVFVISLGLLWQEVFRLNISLRTKALYFLPLLLLFFLFIVNKEFYYREAISERDTPYVQFSHIYLYSDAVRALAEEGDTFAVYPYEELLYWYSGLPSPTRFLFLQSWVYEVPAYRKEIHAGLKKNPPTFVYAKDTLLEPYLSRKDYVSLPLNEVSRSALFVHKQKLPQITERQWEDVRRHGFKKPASNSAILR